VTDTEPTPAATAGDAESADAREGIRDRSVREVVERTRDVIRRTRELLDNSRDLLDRVRNRDDDGDAKTAGSADASSAPAEPGKPGEPGEHDADEASDSHAGTDAMAGGRAGVGQGGGSVIGR
jgi:hypothetical protein